MENMSAFYSILKYLKISVRSFNIKMDHPQPVSGKTPNEGNTGCACALSPIWKGPSGGCKGSMEDEPGEPNARTPCPIAALGPDWGLWKQSEARSGGQAQNVAKQSSRRLSTFQRWQTWELDPARIP